MQNDISMPEKKMAIASKVLDIRNLTESTYVLRLEKNGLQFKAGQYLVLQAGGHQWEREYSIYSPEEAPWIDLLIKEVESGDISKELKHLEIGSSLEIKGIFGFFVLRDQPSLPNHYTFVATGTGISPFHSIIRSNPGIQFDLVHGVRYGYETYDSSDYPADRYHLCTSRENGSHFHGHVTQYLRGKGIRKDSVYYLCGNSAMISEVTDLLEQNGILPENIRTEVFF
jgi:ferredoxin/flavodoxin---NADP+ reductase